MKKARAIINISAVGPLILSATLQAVAGPPILEHPMSQTVSAGEAAYFTVLAPGYATNGNVQWQRDGVNIAGATGPTIQINNATLGDAGAYRAVINTSDPTNITVSDSGTLIVLGADIQPRISLRHLAGSTNQFTIQPFGAAEHYFLIQYSTNFAFDRTLLAPGVLFPMPPQPYFRHGLEATFAPGAVDISFLRAVHVGDLRSTCVANQLRINFGKKAWQIYTGRPDGWALVEPQIDSLYLDLERMRCPLGGSITYNVLGTGATCDIAGHAEKAP